MSSSTSPTSPSLVATEDSCSCSSDNVYSAGDMAGAVVGTLLVCILCVFLALVYLYRRQGSLRPDSSKEPPRTEQKSRQSFVEDGIPLPARKQKSSPLQSIQNMPRKHFGSSTGLIAKSLESQPRSSVAAGRPNGSATKAPQSQIPPKKREIASLSTVSDQPRPVLDRTDTLSSTEQPRPVFDRTDTLSSTEQPAMKQDDDADDGNSDDSGYSNVGEIPNTPPNVSSPVESLQSVLGPLEQREAQSLYVKVGEGKKDEDKGEHHVTDEENEGLYVRADRHPESEAAGEESVTYDNLPFGLPFLNGNQTGHDQCNSEAESDYYIQVDSQDGAGLNQSSTSDNLDGECSIQVDFQDGAGLNQSSTSDNLDGEKCRDNEVFREHETSADADTGELYENFNPKTTEENYG